MNDATNNPLNARKPEPPQDELVDQLGLEIEALLVEEAARAHTSPAELEAKVLALTDPFMLSLLDEALAPEQAPDALADRIIAATMPHAPAPPLVEAGPADAVSPHRSGVLARIAPPTWRYATAAAIVLAAGVGLWWSGQQGPVDSTGPTADAGGDLIPSEFFALTEQSSLSGLTHDIDANIEVVANQIRTYRAKDDSVWSAVDEYEQFLSDLEESDGSLL